MWRRFLALKQTLRVLLKISFLHLPVSNPYISNLSLKTPQTVPPTPGTALQNKIESRLEKSLGSQFNIQLQQQMGAFQASMLEVMKSLRDEMYSMKKAGPSKQPDLITTWNPTTRMLNQWTWTIMDLQFLQSPLKVSSPSMLPGTQILNPNTRIIIPSRNNLKGCVQKPKKHSDKRKHKVHTKYYSQSYSSEEDESSVPIKKSTKPQQHAPPEPECQDRTDPVFYREVDMSDLPSQYAEEVETFRQILDLPDPRETLPRSSTTVLGLDNEKGQQELRPRGPSAMLPLNPILKDAFEKFEQHFLASNLPEGKYRKLLASTAKYYKVGQPCFEHKL